jgi:hypothetical protein
MSITARTLRNVLKEDKRVEAERRGDMGLRYQEWKDGKAGDQVRRWSNSTWSNSSIYLPDLGEKAGGRASLNGY